MNMDGSGNEDEEMQGKHLMSIILPVIDIYIFQFVFIDRFVFKVPLLENVFTMKTNY